MEGSFECVDGGMKRSFASAWGLPSLGYGTLAYIVTRCWRGVELVLLSLILASDSSSCFAVNPHNINHKRPMELEISLDLGRFPRSTPLHLEASRDYYLERSRKV